MAAAVGLAGMTTAPEVVTTQMAQGPGISQQQTQRTATNQNQNQKAPVQRNVQRTGDILNVVGGFPSIFGFQQPGASPKEYGQWLQMTGRQWANMRVKRSRKYRR